ncbi:uncharacterized protein V1516DRAFT_29425 [Lipomyces oligophaga]|uniref:uncharacterized protein n=1 Tax=Lipomyces oligophaga TaxID=45792 RepID=UPI0034CD0A3F
MVQKGRRQRPALDRKSVKLYSATSRKDIYDFEIQRDESSADRDEIVEFSDTQITEQESDPSIADRADKLKSQWDLLNRYVPVDNILRNPTIGQPSQSSDGIGENGQNGRDSCDDSEASRDEIEDNPTPTAHERVYSGELSDLYAVETSSPSDTLNARPLISETQLQSVNKRFKFDFSQTNKYELEQIDNIISSSQAESQLESSPSQLPREAAHRRPTEEIVESDEERVSLNSPERDMDTDEDGSDSLTLIGNSPLGPSGFDRNPDSTSRPQPQYIDSGFENIKKSGVPRFVEVCRSESSPKKSAIPAKILSGLIQGRQGLDTLTEDPSYTLQQQSQAQSTIGNQSISSFAAKPLGLASTAASWILKAHSDVKLSTSFEIWKVLKSNPGYINKSRNYTGFILTHISPEHNSPSTVDLPATNSTSWALLFEKPQELEQTPARTKLSNDIFLPESTLLQLYRPFWKLPLASLDVDLLSKAGFQMDASIREGILLCLHWSFKL